MKVLGIGLPRTGTASLAAALTQLGYKSQHAAGNRYPPQVHDCQVEFGMDHFRRFDDLEAIVECEYWRWLILAYPDAKCILTVRDPNDWYRSIAAHIDAIHNRERKDCWSEIEEADRSHERLFGSKWPLRTLYLDAYARHLLAVKAFCQNRNRPLLIFRVTEGWRLLCKFLDKPVPVETFPWKNRLVTQNNETGDNQ